MPSLVMLPFIQCHQTRGFAEAGGCLNPCSSAESCAQVQVTREKDKQKGQSFNRHSAECPHCATLFRKNYREIAGGNFSWRQVGVSRTNYNLFPYWNRPG